MSECILIKNWVVLLYLNGKQVFRGHALIVGYCHYFTLDSAEKWCSCLRSVKDSYDTEVHNGVPRQPQVQHTTILQWSVLWKCHSGFYFWQHRNRERSEGRHGLREQDLNLRQPHQALSPLCVGRLPQPLCNMMPQKLFHLKWRRYRSLSVVSDI